MLCCVLDPGSDLGLHVDGMSCPESPLASCVFFAKAKFANSTCSLGPSRTREEMGPNMHIHTHTKRPLF